MPQTPDDAQAMIVAAYRSNVPVQQIMDTYGVNTKALYATLRRAGIRPDRPFVGRRPKEWTQDELDCIREMRTSGASVNQITKTLRADRRRVERALQQLEPANRPKP